MKKKRNGSIKYKLLGFTLPIILIGMLILTAVSVSTTKKNGYKSYDYLEPEYLGRAGGCHSQGFRADSDVRH